MCQAVDGPSLRPPFRPTQRKGPAPPRLVRPADQVSPPFATHLRPQWTVPVRNREHFHRPGRLLIFFLVSTKGTSMHCGQRHRGKWATPTDPMAPEILLDSRMGNEDGLNKNRRMHVHIPPPRVKEPAMFCRGTGGRFSHMAMSSPGTAEVTKNGRRGTTANMSLQIPQIRSDVPQITFQMHALPCNTHEMLSCVPE
jgi:hypothetical protein